MQDLDHKHGTFTSRCTFTLTDAQDCKSSGRVSQQHRSLTTQHQKQGEQDAKEWRGDILRGTGVHVMPRPGHAVTSQAQPAPRLSWSCRVSCRRIQNGQHARPYGWHHQLAEQRSRRKGHGAASSFHHQICDLEPFARHRTVVSRMSYVGKLESRVRLHSLCSSLFLELTECLRLRAWAGGSSTA